MEHQVDPAEVKIEESAMAVVIYHDKILTTNECIYGKETLSLPKGHREENEMLLEAAIRECFEETNIVITKDNLVMELSPYSYEFLTPSNQFVRKTIAPFLFRIMREGEPLSKEKRIISVQWMPVVEFISKCTYESVKKIVTQIL